MDKKYKNGLVLGKMNPFTLGHKHLIDSALQQCEMVHLMICSLKTEKIRGIDRFGMIANTYKNEFNQNLRLIHCTDENPQHPNESESLDIFYNNYWVPSVMKYIDNLECVFTSEEYGDEFAQYLGCKHELVDLGRNKFKVSGTAVRNDIYANWDLLPPATQKFFRKRICVVGPESTGKSTMCESLADYYKTSWVEEYGRKYVETITTDMLKDWDFEVIVRNHARLVDKANHLNENMFLFVDTDAIVTKTFSSMYLKRYITNSNIENYIMCQKFDLYLLLTPEVNWIEDKTNKRDFPAEQDRWKHYNLILNELKKNRFNYVIIDGSSYRKRLEKAYKEIDKFKQV